MIEEFDKELVKNQGEKINVVKLASAAGITETVIKSVTSTIMKTKSESAHLTRGKKLKTIILDTNPVSWEVGSMEKSDVVFYNAKFRGSISEIETNTVDYDKADGQIWIAPKPFSKGAMRLAYIATNQASPIIKSVAKESIAVDEEFNTEKYHKEFIENHVVSSLLAKSFNDALKSKGLNHISLRYVNCCYFHIVEKGKYFTFEEYLDGEFKKWISNASVYSEFYSSTIDAFVHWTYQATNEYLIVLDLQGLEKKSADKTEYILSDPAIISPKGFDRFGLTNLGAKGVQKYFQNHSCNDICKALGLKKHKLQTKPDRACI
jgi:hypothetical protein